MRFSFVTLPDYPLSESLERIKTADELGFYGCYAADETWHKDLYVLFAAAASETSQIRMGPSLAPIALREPTLVAQAVATLDERLVPAERVHRTRHRSARRQGPVATHPR